MVNTTPSANFRSRSFRETWAPLALFLALAGLIAALWWNVNLIHRQRLEVETRVTAEQLRIRLENWFDDRAGVVEHLGAEWSAEGEWQADEFRREAQIFLDAHPGFQALNWIDSDWVIRVIVPEAGNEPALNKDLHLHPSPGVKKAIARAAETGMISRTPMIELLQGSNGFATYYPVHDAGGDLVGFVNGVFRIDTLVDACLAEAHLRERFRFEIHEEDGRVLYEHGVDWQPHEWRHVVQMSVRIVDRPWTLEFAPSAFLLRQSHSLVDDLISILGLALAAMLAWYYHLNTVKRRGMLESGLRFRSLTDDVLDRSQVGIFILDADFKVVWINRAIERYFGLRREEVVGKDKRALIRGRIAGIFEDPDAFVKKVFATYDDNTAIERFECHVLEGEGRKERWLEHRSHPIETGLFAGGRIEHYYGITERKHAETEALRATGDLKLLFAAVGHPMAILDPEHGVLAANPAACACMEMPEEKLLGKKCWEIFHGPDQNEPSECCPMEAVRSNGRVHAHDMAVEMFGGTYLVSCTPILDEEGELQKVIHIATDITERVRAEEALAESEAKVRAIFENASDGILVADATTKKLLSGNGEITKMLGYPLEEFLKLSVHNIHPANDLSYVLEQFERQLRGEICIASDIPVLRKDGSVFYADISSNAVVLSNTQCLVGLFRDATERRRVEEAIRRRTEQLKVLLDSTRQLNANLETRVVLRKLVSSAMALMGAQSGTAGLIRDGKMVFAEYNEKGKVFPIDYTFERGYGVPGWVMETREPYITNDAAHDPHVIAEIRKALGFYNLADVPIIGRSGESLGCFEIHNTLERRPFNKQDIEILQGLADQASVALENALLHEEQQRLEAQLRQAQKMEAVGQLAGGVAHDFNNILQAVLGYVEFAKEGLSPDDERFQNIEEINKGALKAAALTRQLLAFSRRQVLAPVDLDLNDLVAGLLKMLRRLIGEDIELDFISGHNLGVVRADPGQAEQILMNLCINAHDAMPDGGGITIETENVVIDQGYCKTHPWAEVGRYVLLSVTDTGDGMDKGILDQIFEPFFTTKEVGKGTGLGLATVYGIVKQHEGLIHVYSDIGKGTTFKVYLPIVERSAATVDSKINGPTVGGTETILLAEDEETVRNVAKRILEGAGYTVIAAADGAEAVALFKEHSEEIRMAILDVVMPHLGGKEVYGEIKTAHPDLPILFSSGYSVNAIHTRFVLDDGMQLLPKPYNRRDLLRRVREVLDA